MSLKELINRKESIQNFIKGVLWLCVFGIGWLIWSVLFAFLTGDLNAVITGLFLFFLITAFAFLFEESLSMIRLSKKSKFRLTYLVSISLPVIIILFFALMNLDNGNLANKYILLKILIVIIISFLGGLLGTILIVVMHKNLVENYPPSIDLQNRILRLHKPIQNSLVNESFSKRLFDIGLSIIGIFVSLPFMVVISFLILFEDPGPVFYIKNSVGKAGENFKLIKFRTLTSGAEESVSVVAGSDNNEVVLRVGKILRKTALDELPQLFNILNGEMSFVGPRPHRTYLVLQYVQEVPGFIDRHRVLPGLAGLAQVAGNASTPPHQKVRYDRIYINNISLGFDLKLLFLSFMIAFWYRWQADWNGKVPLKWLHH